MPRLLSALVLLSLGKSSLCLGCAGMGEMLLKDQGIMEVVMLFPVRRIPKGKQAENKTHSVLMHW